MLAAVAVDQIHGAAVESLEPVDDVPGQDRAVRLGVPETFQLRPLHADEHDPEINLGRRDLQIGLESNVVGVPFRIKPSLCGKNGLDGLDALLGIQITPHGQNGPGHVHGQFAGIFGPGFVFHRESRIRQLFFQIGDQLRVRDERDVVVASALIGLHDPAEIIPVKRLRHDAAEDQPAVVHLQRYFGKLLKQTAEFLIRLKRGVVHRDTVFLFEAARMDGDDGLAGRRPGYLESAAGDAFDFDVRRIRLAGFDGKRHVQNAFFSDGNGDLLKHHVMLVGGRLPDQRLGDRFREVIL